MLQSRSTVFRAGFRPKLASVKSKKVKGYSTSHPTVGHPGLLQGVRVLDMSRVLAGPWATQHLADMGADVIKVEMPHVGDDTRSWGPPFLKNQKTGKDTTESAYYLSTNRNKRSITVDITKSEGQTLLHELAKESDVFIENFKVGNLKKYHLDYETLSKINPKLVYASITGFGQTGPKAHHAGYDLAAQAMGGLMSITGAKDGPPFKVGVAITDIMTGMYAASGILAGLFNAQRTGKGDWIDASLLDTQLAFLSNVGMNYLVGDYSPTRIGNQHASIVPYSAFETQDGYMIIAAGNDHQFAQLCITLDLPAIATDARFITNQLRVANREALYKILNERFIMETKEHWIDKLNDTSVPHAAVNTVREAFNDPQAIARGARITMKHPFNDECPMIANPLRMTENPVQYVRPPPVLGQHTQEVLTEVLGYSTDHLASLKSRKII